MGYTDEELLQLPATKTSFTDEKSLQLPATKTSFTDEELFGSPVPAVGGIKPKSAEGGFIASAKQAIGSTIKGLGQAAADIAPGVVSQDNALKQYGQSVVDANPTIVHGFGDVVNYPGKTITEATGNAAGSLGLMLGLRAAGAGITAAAPLAGPAAPVVAGVGQLVSWGGPAAVAALPSYGGIRDAQVSGDADSATSWKDKAVATLGAATVGIIESKFGPQEWALKLTTESGRKSISKMLSESTIKGAIAKGAVIEGTEELVQNPVEQLASYQNPLSPENLKDTAFSGVMGAIGGGVLGGGVHVGAKFVNEKTAEQAKPAQDPITEAVQTELANKATPDGVDVTEVKNGVATAVTLDGTTIKAPVEELATATALGAPAQSVATDTYKEIPAVQPETMRFEINGATHDYMPPEGQTLAAVQEATKNMSAAEKVDWLDANDAPNSKVTPTQEVMNAPQETVPTTSSIGGTGGTQIPMQPGVSNVSDGRGGLLQQETPQSIQVQNTVQPVALNVATEQPLNSIKEQDNGQMQGRQREGQGRQVEGIGASQEAPLSPEHVAIQKVADTVVKGAEYQGATTYEQGPLHQFVTKDGKNFSVLGEPTKEDIKASHDKMEATWAKYGAPQGSITQGAGGSTQEQVHTEAKTFLGNGYDNLIRKGKLGIVQSETELPPAGIPITGTEGRVAGRYYPNLNKVMLVSDNLAPGDAEGVIRHEAVHALLQEDPVFVKQHDKILSDFEKLSKTDQGMKDAIAQVPANTQEHLKTEEALAYWRQNPDNHNHSLFKRIVSAVKAALIRLGLTPSKFTASDLSTLFSQGTKAWANRTEETSPELTKAVTNPDILNSVVSNKLQAAITDTKTSVMEIVKNPGSTLTQYLGKFLAVMPFSTQAEIFGRRGKDKITQLVDIDDHMNKLKATTTRLVDDYFRIHQDLTKAAGKYLDNVKQAMADSTFHQIDPTKALIDQDWVPAPLMGMPDSERLAAAEKAWKDAKMRKTTNKTFAQAYNTTVAAYNSMPNPAKIKFLESAKYLEKLRNLEKDTQLSFIESISESESQLRADLMAQFNSSFSSVKGLYFPLTRDGNYTLRYTDPDTKQVHVEQFKTIKEREIAKAEAVSLGIPAEVISTGMLDKMPRGSVVLPQQLLDQLRKTVEDKYTKNIDPGNETAMAIAKEQAAQALEDFNQTLLRWLPETSAMKNSIRRKNSLGFNRDMLQGTMDYVQRHSSSIAWNTYGKKIDESLASLAERNKEISREGGVDTTVRDQVLVSTRKWLQAVRDERVGAVSSVIGKLTTGYMMTSPSTMLVQLTQLPLLTLPHLAVKYNLKDASAALGRALTKAFNKNYTTEAMLGNAEVNAVYDMLHRTVSHTDALDNRSVGEDFFTEAQKQAAINKLKAGPNGKLNMELLFLREAEANNLLDISATHEANEISKGETKTVLGKAMHYAMMPMQWGELASRKAAILASYELATVKGENFATALSSAASVVDKTLFNFSKHDKGWLLQKEILRVPLTFQTFRIKTAIRLGMMMHDSVRGETPEMKKAAAKEFAGVVMMSGSLAGAMGVPFAGTAFAIAHLLAGIFGDDDEPYDPKLEFTNWLKSTWLGDTGGSLAAFGLPTLVGMNLSNRLGLGDTLGVQASPPDNLHGSQLAAWWAGWLIGPAYSVADSWFKGYDEMSKGHYMRGLEDASPKPIRDALKAYRLDTEGLKDRGGKKLMADADITPGDLLMQFMGFAPADIAKAQTANANLNAIKGKIAERRGKLIKEAAAAFLESRDTTEVIDKIKAFNSKLPFAAINGESIRLEARKQVKGDTLGDTRRKDVMVANRYQIPVYAGGVQQ